jgi:hypothetical protein
MSKSELACKLQGSAIGFVEVTLLQKLLLVTGCFYSSVTGKLPVTGMPSLVISY